MSYQICITRKKITPTAYEFIDIAGLVRGSSQGEGLGNQFLSHIREVDAICQVLRCFDDSGVQHVDETIDPIRDLETIKIELFLSDLEIIENRLSRIDKKVKASVKEALEEAEVLNKIKEVIVENGNPRDLDLSTPDLKLIKSFNLLILKPMIYIANVSEDDLLDL
jgi:ribosome-binding ATPase